MTNSVQNSFNLQVLYKMLKKHTNLKVHICPQMRVKLITKKIFLNLWCSFYRKTWLQRIPF